MVLFLSAITLRSILGILILFLGIGNIIPTSSLFALSYPTQPPQDEVTGGYFHRYFMNMMDVSRGNNQDCNKIGYALIGFNYTNGDLYNESNGTLRCHDLLSDFLGVVDAQGTNASGFTGSMVGEDGKIPRWYSGGTLLTGSVLSQSGSSIFLGNGSADGSRLVWR